MFTTDFLLREKIFPRQGWSSVFSDPICTKSILKSDPKVFFGLLSADKQWIKLTPLLNSTTYNQLQPTFRKEFI